MICTGRSDFPNQVNNVLCFPYIFRGALDCGATTINEEMKLAAVEAIAALARETPSDVVARAYGGEVHGFGPESLIPSPFDPRLILRIAPAVAARRHGVRASATRPIDGSCRLCRQPDALRLPLRLHHEAAVHGGQGRPPSASSMPRARTSACCAPLRWCSRRGWPRPILIGRPSVIESRIERFGLTVKPGRDFEVIDPADDPRYKDYSVALPFAAGRQGVTPDAARTIVRSNTTVIGALALQRGDADAMICGLEGGFMRHLRDVRADHRPGARRARLLGPVAGDHRQGRVLPLRHAGQARSLRRGNRRDGDPGGRARQALRPGAEDRASVACRFRLLRHDVVAQDAQRPRHPARQRAPTSRPMARCRPIRRCPRPCAS